MSKTKSFLLGIAVGGVVSATATLFTAPLSGKDMRLRAKQQGSEWMELLESVKRDGLKLKNQITQTSKEGAAMIKELTQEIKTSISEWKDSVEPHQEKIQEYLEQIETSLKELEEKVKKD